MKPAWIILHTEDGPGNFATVEAYHKRKWYFRSSLGYFCGYQYFIEKDGKVIQARKDDEEGAHTIGRNLDSIGICLAGDGDIELPTPAQRIALRDLVKRKLIEWAIYRDRVTFHRRWNIYKTCPGTKIDGSWLEELLADPKPQDPDLPRKMLELSLWQRIKELYEQLKNINANNIKLS